MSNLHAEKRPDKRGNIVTRWVKSFSAGANVFKKPIPAPAWSDKERDAFYKMDQTMVRFFPYADDRRGQHLHKNIKFLTENAPEMLDRISHVDASIYTYSHWKECIKHTKMHADTPAEHDEVLEHCRRKEALLPFINRLTDLTPDNEWRHGPNLRKFSAGVADLSDDMPADEWDSKHEALTIACFLKSDHNGVDPDDEDKVDWGSYADMSETVDYIQANREEVDEMLPELFQRGFIDFELLKAMVESPSEALREGEL